MDFYQRAKRYSIEKFTTHALSLLAGASTENLIRLTYLAEKIPQKDSYREKIRWIRTLFQTNHPGLSIARRVLNETHSLHRRKLISNFIVNQLLVGTNRRKAFEAERGFYPPDAMLISPTMRCNLNCYGCYSGVYSQEDLPYEVLDRLMGECKEMGIYLVMMTGGEPFLRQDLFDLFEKHDDMMFQVYTNGTLIDQKMIDRFVALGNVSPAISLEGLREETDGRRGRGQFDRVLRIMDGLKEAGIFFAVSTTQTSRNHEVLTSDVFIDFLVERGCILLWNFHYVPIGRNPDLSLMVTPEQRCRARERLAYFRATRPMLFVDFWNDGCLTQGCIAAGRKYFHVNARGDVEPCIFCHFASDNIKEKSLMEALNSPLFREMRSHQPLSDNYFRPCLLIDHPEQGREFALQHAKYFTHEGADQFFTDFAQAIDSYAKAYGEIAEAAWKEKMEGSTAEPLSAREKVVGRHG
ncbi:MAG TPA: radical SAM protein [Thermodesulfobacteriota bacterium]|nr:radical SAM protein [Thermodesulfobacteriota bacterium]